MQTVIKAPGRADFLALVPELVGFAPTESVVLVPFRGNRTAGALRVALPASESPAVQKRVATSIVGTLCKLPGVQSIAIVIYTKAPFGNRRVPPHAAFARIVARRIEQSGFELHESLCQAADGWGSYVDDSTPAGGRPLREITDSVIADAVPEQLRRRKIDAPNRIADADPETRGRVADGVARYRELIEAGPSAQLSDELAPLDDITMFLEEALSWDESALSRRDALLLFTVQSATFRDLAMMQWASTLATGDRILDAADGASGDPSAFDPRLADMLIGIGPRPDPARVEKAIALLENLVSRASDEARPAPLTMLAWLNWALGLGSVAHRHIAEALRIDADYHMAQHIDAMLNAGMLPEWAFHE